jgi:hypothetical protein
MKASQSTSTGHSHSALLYWASRNCLEMFPNHKYIERKKLAHLASSSHRQTHPYPWYNRGCPQVLILQTIFLAGDLELTAMDCKTTVHHFR